MTLDSNRLKLIACISMLIDHAAIVFPVGDMAYFICRSVIGRIAFPLFCFLLAEGFMHTRNQIRYIASIAVLAVLSEIPFNLVISGQMVFPQAQNICFTLVCGLLFFLMINRISIWNNKDLGAVLILIAFVGISLLAQLLHFDYGMFGIAALTACYVGSGTDQFLTAFPSIRRAKFLQRHDGRSVSRLIGLTIACICLNTAGAFLALIPAWYYDGTIRRKSAIIKYTFYLFYPIHLLLLFCLHFLIK